MVKETLSPESYVVEAIPCIAELKLPPDKISWIAEVKRNSEKWKDERPDRKTAFDLVELHLMMQRELKFGEFSHRCAYLQKETEKKADEIIGYILQNAEIAGGFLADVLRVSIERLRAAKTRAEKLTAITLYISRIHYGGSPSGMSVFAGYPKYKHYERDRHLWDQKDVKIFFGTLHDL